MKTRTIASLMLATLFALAACGQEKEEAEGDEAAESSVATATAPDSAALAEQAALAKEAKIVEADARATALKEVPGATVEAVELEKEDGKLIYSYDLKIAGKDGIEEVHVDAISGKLLSRSHESPDDEKKEAKTEEKKGGGKGS